MDGEDVQLGRGTVQAASLAVQEAVTAERKKAGGDPKLAAKALFRRLKADPDLASALFVSFAGQAYLDLRRGKLR
jgi:hypothetical protein